MHQLDELQGWGRDRPAVLLCGGPSAPHDLRRAKQELGSAEYDLISVNNHGLLYLGEVAWFYAHDKRMVEHLKEEQATVIVHYDCRNLREQDIHAGIVPFIRLSGPEALWVCDWFEYSRIHIVGVDFYQGKRRYWHQWSQSQQPTKVSMDQAAKWREIKRKLQNPERVICYNDALKKVFDES